ncbi:MAG: DNA helicase RecQ [Anaerolineae bacterium]|nr:MAG: DNA helicase RecQ [Anaerolineae bacterium]
MTPQEILKTVFGYDTFRPLQRQVIENVLARRDSLVVMPTGGGKSLCYQIPALMFSGLTVVVSPLIALMKDQVEQLQAYGIPALYLNSTLSPEAYAANMEHIRRGQAKLLYVAPETLLTPRLFSLLDTLQVDLLTIDEAHCISEWGHDFRPEYRQLVEVRRRYPRAVCLALTATATPRVRADIVRSLGFSRANEFVASFNRENLYIQVSPKTEPLRQTLRFLERFKDQSGIIYCFSRKQVDELAAALVQRGYSVRPYHAGLEDSERRRNQEDFIRDNVQIMVATIAFGMGINKPNVRFVIHYDLPKSIEGYYQEIGRAGRDGLPAHCLLLYSYSDAAKLRYFIDKKQGNERQVAMQQLNAMMKYAEDEQTCRRKPLLQYFGEPYLATKCNNCDNCTAAPPVLADVTIPAQKFLSCVKRTGERFGAGHVIDVLRGSKSERILRLGHDKLSTYGIGADLTEKQWLYLARQLLQMGYLKQDEEFRTLSLTEKALEALRKRSPIYGQLQPAQECSPSREIRKSELDYNHALFALLRQKRKEMADQAGVPPYVIFSDKTLVEMAAYYPQSRESLLKISGVGMAKLNQYGPVFLQVIRDYCRKHGLTEKETRSEKTATRSKEDAKRRYMLVGKTFNDGASLQQLVERFHLSQEKIVDDLVRYATAGHPLRFDESLRAFATSTPAEQNQVFQAFDELGAAFLKPIFEKFAGRVSYDELRILRLLYLSQKTV